MKRTEFALSCTNTQTCTHAHTHARTHTHSFPSHWPLCPHILYTHLPTSPPHAPLSWPLFSISANTPLCDLPSGWVTKQSTSPHVSFPRRYEPQAITSRLLSMVWASSRTCRHDKPQLCNNQPSHNTGRRPMCAETVCSFDFYYANCSQNTPPTPPPFCSAKGTQLCMLHGITTNQLMGTLLSNTHRARSKLEWDILTSRVFISH